MVKRVAVFLIGVSICYACGSGSETAKGEDSIAGTYVREYSSEILNELSGNKVGMRTIRDTLFIATNGSSYRVTNSKWRMNDYDHDGWRNMEHAETGPMPTFDATYNEASGLLSPSTAGIVPELSIEKNGKLLVGKKSKIPFTKIQG